MILFLSGRNVLARPVSRPRLRCIDHEQDPRGVFCEQALSGLVVALSACGDVVGVGVPQELGVVIRGAEQGFEEHHLQAGEGPAWRIRPPEAGFVRDLHEGRRVVLIEIVEVDAPLGATLALDPQHQDLAVGIDMDLVAGEEPVLVAGQVAGVAQEGVALDQGQGKGMDPGVGGREGAPQRGELGGAETVPRTQRTVPFPRVVPDEPPRRMPFLRRRRHSRHKIETWRRHHVHEATLRTSKIRWPPLSSHIREHRGLAHQGVLLVAGASHRSWRT